MPPEFRHVRQQFHGDVLLFGFGFHRGVLRLVGAARSGAARTERLRCYEQDGDDAPSTRFRPNELISVCFPVVASENHCAVLRYPLYSTVTVSSLAFASSTLFAV